MNRNTAPVIAKVLDRAAALGIGQGDRITQFIDMDLAASHYEGMDLEVMLQFDDFNFAHDFIGIQNHIDRRNRTVSDLFLPRCVRSTPKETPV